MNSCLGKINLRLSFAPWLGCLLVCAASPALAEAPRDQQERGIYLSLTDQRAEVSNLDFRLASNAAGGSGARLELERGGEVSYQISWLLPDKKGAVGLTYWEFAEQQGSAKRGSSFVPTGILNGTTVRSGVDGSARVLARAVDATYRRDFNATHPEFRASWGVGLRYFRYEHTLVAEYLTAGGLLADLALEEVDSLGVGPRAAASFEYYWGRRWSLAGGLGVATLFGRTDHRNFSLTNINTATPTTTTREQRGVPRTFSQVDLDMHVVFVAWKGLDVTGGYRVSHWYDTRTRQSFTNEFAVERVTFEGPYLAVGYRF